MLLIDHWTSHVATDQRRNFRFERTKLSRGHPVYCGCRSQLSSRLALTGMRALTIRFGPRRVNMISSGSCRPFWKPHDPEQLACSKLIGAFVQFRTFISESPTREHLDPQKLA
jgi:hypothetical protein